MASIWTGSPSLRRFIHASTSGSSVGVRTRFIPARRRPEDFAAALRRLVDVFPGIWVCPAPGVGYLKKEHGVNCPALRKILGLLSDGVVKAYLEACGGKTFPASMKALGITMADKYAYKDVVEGGAKCWYYRLPGVFGDSPYHVPKDQMDVPFEALFTAEKLQYVQTGASMTPGAAAAPPRGSGR